MTSNALPGRQHHPVLRLRRLWPAEPDHRPAPRHRDRRAVVLVGGPALYYAGDRACAVRRIGLGHRHRLAIFHVLVVSPWGIVTTYICERFPTHVRASGYGIGYSLAVVIPSFSGIYLLWLPSLMPYVFTPMVLVALAAVLIMSARCWGRRRATWSCGGVAALSAAAPSCIMRRIAWSMAAISSADRRRPSLLRRHTTSSAVRAHSRAPDSAVPPRSGRPRSTRPRSAWQSRSPSNFVRAGAVGAHQAAQRRRGRNGKRAQRRRPARRSRPWGNRRPAAARARSSPPPGRTPPADAAATAPTPPRRGADRS